MAQHCIYIHVHTYRHDTRVIRNKPRNYIAELYVYNLNSSVGRALVPLMKDLGFDSQFWSKRFYYNAYSFSTVKFANNKE